MKSIMRTIFAFVLLAAVVFGTIPYAGKTAAAVSFSPTYQTVKIGVRSTLRGNAAASVTLTSSSGFNFGTYNDDRSFRQTGSTSETTVYASSSGGTVQVRTGGGTELASGTKVAIVPQSASSTGTAMVADGTTVSYYGGFELIGSDSVITVVNYVDMEDYVKGVVPREMLASWSIEALKAQALCARTYAAANFRKYSSYGFDMCNTTYCQVYGGVYSLAPYASTINEAVDSTRGQYILYGGTPITAYFSAADGGATENSENVWSAALPYCRGIIDEYEVTPSLYQTTNTYTAEELYAKLLAKNPNIGISDIRSVDCTYTATGNMLSVKFTDSNGNTATFSKENARTNVLGAFTDYTSQRFQITSMTTSAVTSEVLTPEEEDALTFDDTDDTAAAEAEDEVRMTAVELEDALEAAEEEAEPSVSAAEATLSTFSTSFTVASQGYGHNIGMSQYGAYYMAKAGKSYTEILTYYYTGITIAGTNPFSDVSGTDWFNYAVTYVYDNGIFAGTSATTFSPKDTMTRGQLVTILGKMSGIDASAYAGNGGFSDVSSSMYYAPFIQWAVGQGLAVGYGDGRFGPDDPVTREDICVFLMKYGNLRGATFPQVNAPVTFSDAGSGSSYALEAISIMQQAGVVSGYQGAFNPRSNSSRAEVASMISVFHRDVL